MQTRGKIKKKRHRPSTLWRKRGSKEKKKKTLFSEEKEEEGKRGGRIPRYNNKEYYNCEDTQTGYNTTAHSNEKR